jgi:hypothetical protein
MTDEQRLQAITNMLILVRDNLFRGMSKSIQKLQAQSINEVLELPNYTESPQRPWQGLTDEDVAIASAEFDLKSKMAYRAGMYKAQIILRKKNDSTY